MWTELPGPRSSTLSVSIWALLACACLSVTAGAADAPGRVVVPLDGEWGIEESSDPVAPPAAFARKVPVPGLADLAAPPFEDVGVESPKRKSFWYRREFTVPAARERAVLRVRKAQFGTAVLVNGKPAGDHLGSFTSGYFEIGPLLKAGGPNEVVIRVGANPSVLPKEVPPGTDQEKTRWIPGIYDSVDILLFDGPRIRSVQVAPRIKPPAVQVQTVLENPGAAREIELVHAARTWKEGAAVGETTRQKVSLAAGETRTVTVTIPLPGARPWTPDDPFLHVLATSTGGDSVETRFGLREFRFHTPTRLAYLNDEPCYLRGSNITLHRFFEDPKRGRLPWDRAWVRRLLVEIPRKMGWNSFRFCIGPVPDFWLDLADEAGLLIQHEFFIWGYRPEWSLAEVKAEFREWLEDSWNHPSVAIWDSSNETRTPHLGGEVIPAVRGLDLSNRPWENGYNAPQGPDDPVEDHPYLFLKGSFDTSRLESMPGTKTDWNSYHPTDHAVIINEYDWLWLDRDGTPTRLTEKVFEGLVGKDATPDARREAAAYLLGGLTEFWRARRQMAGVLHFVYLGYSYPGGFTCDNFVDLENLVLEPRFEDRMRDAFAPLGVYLDFWRPAVAPGADLLVPVVVVNDLRERREGKITVSLTAGGDWWSPGAPAGGAGAAAESLAAPLVMAERGFSVPPFGVATYRLPLRAPDRKGAAVLEARLEPAGGGRVVRSVRKVEVK